MKGNQRTHVELTHAKRLDRSLFHHNDDITGTSHNCLFVFFSFYPFMS